MKRIIILSVLLFLMTAFRVTVQTVYASDKDEKYHTSDCNMSGDANSATLAAAKKAGKTPCAMTPSGANG